MNEIGFRNWAVSNGKNKKTVSDTVSRLRRLEHELNIDIDIEYKKDQCNYLLSLFNHTGNNEGMKKYNTSLPIGKYSLSTFKYAINQYITYLAANA